MKNVHFAKIVQCSEHRFLDRNNRVTERSRLDERPVREHRKMRLQ